MIKCLCKAWNEILFTAIWNITIIGITIGGNGARIVISAPRTTRWVSIIIIITVTVIINSTTIMSSTITGILLIARTKYLRRNHSTHYI